MLREKTQVRDRNIVTANDDRRQLARLRLFGDSEVAKQVLSPAYQWRKLVKRNKEEAARVGKQAAKVARKGAPWAGMIGAGVALFAYRQPISNWISRLRKSKGKAPKGE